MAGAAPRRVVIILNPRAGQGRHDLSPEQLRAAFAEGGAEVRLLQTSRRGEAENWAASLRAEETDLLVCAGGDGTLNEVLNGLRAPVPVGILPLGTANVLAREMGVPLGNSRAAVRALLQGTPTPVDLGDCNGRRFALVASIGFDAEAVRDTPPALKDLIGAPAYVLAGLRKLAELRRPLRYRLTVGRRTLVSRGMMLVVANAATYAGWLQIAPAAALADGWLDCCLFRERSRLGFLLQWLLVLLRRHQQHPGFLCRRVREVRVECRPAAAVQLDGDYWGRTPVEIRVLPAAVRLVRAGSAAPAEGEGASL